MLHPSEDSPANYSDYQVSSKAPHGRRNASYESPLSIVFGLMSYVLTRPTSGERANQLWNATLLKREIPKLRTSERISSGRVVAWWKFSCLA